ncbi:acyltransferase domain-containing protein, partial [Streptomyces sp. SID7499]|nr:acyltransferase domain-containing protein [Streptomyces sp. SID7499]
EDLRVALFPASDDADALDLAARRLTETRLAQPALFTTQYALARLLGAWGVQPAALLGHSIGELTAACLSGVL